MSVKTVFYGVIITILWLLFLNDYLNIQALIAGIAQNGNMQLIPSGNPIQDMFGGLISSLIFPVLNPIISIQLILPQLLQIYVVFTLVIPCTLLFIASFWEVRWLQIISYVLITLASISYVVIFVVALFL